MQLCLSYAQGGLEIYATQLVRFLDDKTQNTIVIAKDSQLTTYLTQVKSPVYQLKRSIFSASSIAKIIDKHKIDIIHIHWTKDLPIGVLAKKLSKHQPKLIQTRHMGMTRFKNDFYHRFLYKNTDLIIAVTQQVKTQITQFIDKSFRPKVIACYIGVEKPVNISATHSEKLKEKYNLNAPFIAMIVGRIEQQKGQHIVIKAVSKLVKQGLNIQLLIAGHAMLDNYLAQLKSLVTKLELDKYVIFTGFISNTSELMQLSDVVILATKKETFGMVLIEAMQANVAVIASDNGGPLEIIDHNKTGLLFKCFDADDLAKKIAILHNDFKLKNTLAFQGQKEATLKFNANKQFQKVLDIYTDLI